MPSAQAAGEPLRSRGRGPALVPLRSTEGVAILEILGQLESNLSSSRSVGQTAGIDQPASLDGYVSILKVSSSGVSVY